MPDVFFSGPEGRLEGKIHEAPGRDSPIALILHQDPKRGFNMNNRLVWEIHYLFHRLGVTVMRFNFRGVGRSEGTYDEGIGELSDAAAALDYLQTRRPDARQCWVAGAAFGSWIGMQLLMRRPEIVGFISVAPPAHTHDFSFLAPCPSSGLIINGLKDRIAPPEDTYKLVAKLKTQKGIEITHKEIETANHVFEGNLDILTAETEGYLRMRMGMPPHVPCHG